MQCPTCIFMLCVLLSLYTLLKLAGQDDDNGMTYQPVKKLSFQLNQCALYFFMWQSELPSEPRDGATCPLECAKLWSSAKNVDRCCKKCSCNAFVTGILSWLWLVDASCKIADLNLVNRSVSWWAIGLFLYIFIQTEDAFQTVNRQLMVTCPFCLHWWHAFTHFALTIR